MFGVGLARFSSSFVCRAGVGNLVCGLPAVIKLRVAAPLVSPHGSPEIKSAFLPVMAGLQIIVLCRRPSSSIPQHTNRAETR